MKKDCLVGIGVAVLIYSVLFCFWNSARIKSSGVGVDSADLEWLPTDISNVTFVSGNMIRTAEFDIEKSSFENWCASTGKPLAILQKNTDVLVLRPNEQLERIGKIKRPAQPYDRSAWISKRFEEGDLFYKDRWDNGGGLSVGYDVSTGRGYYDYASH